MSALGGGPARKPAGSAALGPRLRGGWSATGPRRQVEHADGRRQDQHQGNHGPLTARRQCRGQVFRFRVGHLATDDGRASRTGQVRVGHFFRFRSKENDFPKLVLNSLGRPESPSLKQILSVPSSVNR